MEAASPTPPPCVPYDSGIKAQGDFSSDGNALSAALDQSTVGLHSILRSGGIYSAVERFQVSLEALLQLATHEAARPGRKFIVWISPGWPLLSGPGVEVQMDTKQEQRIFNNVVNLSTLLRQGRIPLYSIDPLAVPNSAAVPSAGGFVKGISKPRQAYWGDVALQVIAVQSGGLALTAGNDIAAQLQKCLADSQAYYEISFAPSLTSGETHTTISKCVSQRWRGRAHSSRAIIRNPDFTTNATSLNNRYFDVGRCFRRHSNQANRKVTSD